MDESMDVVGSDLNPKYYKKFKDTDRFEKTLPPHMHGYDSKKMEIIEDCYVEF